MTVTSVSEDRTWIVHLNAWLSLRQERQVAGRERVRASWTLRSACLELRNIALEMESFFHGQEVPRKLDVRKLYASVLRVRRNLRLLSVGPDSQGTDEYLCLEVVSSTMLVKTASFLKSVGQAQYLHTHPQMSTTLLVAADQICSAGLALADALRTFEPLAVKGCSQQALLTVWSLSSISSAPTISESQRASVFDLLQEIGELARIPQALGLVDLRSLAFEHKQSD